jgi:excisionase family DNA binding protein
VKLLTVKETAALLRVTPHTVYRMTRTGALPSLRLGQQIRFDEDTLSEWLAAQPSAKAPGDGSRLLQS